MFLWNIVENTTFAPLPLCDLCVKLIRAFVANQQNAIKVPLGGIRGPRGNSPQFPVVFPLANFPLYTNFTQSNLFFTFCEVLLILCCLLKTHIIKISSIKEFVLLHPDSDVSLNEWVNNVKVSNWQKPDDIKKTFATADLLGNNSSRIIFNIGGNKYRLIVKYYFGEKQVHLFICWIGTHAAYTKLCKKEKQYHIHIY